ncbi:unnamed protein product [Symbiodinium sp. CCMP2592]|nr:unnamed protein product [Symbiodinium sp. CCMP2592]
MELSRWFRSARLKTLGLNTLWSGFYAGFRAPFCAYLMEKDTPYPAELLQGFEGAMDEPFHLLYEEVLRTIPDAKFVYTLADPNTWYDSYSRFYDHLPHEYYGPVDCHAPPAVHVKEPMNRMVALQAKAGQDPPRNPNDVDNRGLGQSIGNVFRTIPKERLLVFNLSDCWTPLCDFLGKPVPDEAFPHVDRFELSQRWHPPRGCPSCSVTLSAYAAKTSSDVESLSDYTTTTASKAQWLWMTRKVWLESGLDFRAEAAAKSYFHEQLLSTLIAKAMTSAHVRTWQKPNGVELTVFEATRLVANCTDWQVVMGALQRLRLHSVALDVVCLTAACKALQQALQWQRALSLFHGAAALALAANERTYGVALAACAGSERGWKDAVHLFGCMPSVRLEQNSFLQSAAVTALDAALHGWSAALSLMVQLAGRGTPSNIVASNAVFSTCAQHWPVTLSLLRWVRGRSLQADAFTSNSVLAALGGSSQWHRSLSAVGGMSRKSLPFQQVTFNSAIASCRAGHWATALWLLGSSIKASVVTYSACVSACEKSYKWQLPCSLLFSLCQHGLVPNAVAEGTVLQALTWAAQWRRTLAALQAATPSAPAFNAVLRSLGAAWERGLAQLEQMILHRQQPDVCSTNQLLASCQSAGAWHGALAILEAEAATASTRDSFLEARHSAQIFQLGGVVHPPGDATGPRPRSRAIAEVSRRSLAELVADLWSMAVLASDDLPLRQSIREEIRRRIIRGQVGLLETPSLGNLAWALATTAEDIQLQEPLSKLREELLVRARVLPGQCPRRVLGDLAEALLTASWAGRLLELPVSEGEVSEVLASLGGDLDGRRLLHFLPSLPTMAREGQEVPSSFPRVRLSFHGGLVLLKPSGWQIYDKVAQEEGPRSRGNVTAFLGAWWPRQPTLLRDFSCNCGFLHRLDVPSSGLILAASRYETYFDLRLQLATGALRREYAVLCHGFIPSRAEINAPVVWSSSSVSRDELTKVKSGGWPAKTQLLTCASAVAEECAVTLLDIRIQTGRRHQIRTHLAHIGAASVADGMLPAKPSVFMDGFSCSHFKQHPRPSNINDCYACLTYTCHIRLICRCFL